MSKEDHTNQLEQLQKAKDLAMVHQPGQMLPRVLETGLSLYKINQTNDLSRFCTQLFLDICTHDQIDSNEKPFIMNQFLSEFILMCQNQNQVDYITYKNIILCFGNCYDGLFDLVAKTSNEKLWNEMCQLKDIVIRYWRSCWPLKESSDSLKDHSRSIGVKLASVKFMSKLVIVHTSGNNDISISSIPDGHPIIKNRQSIESEGKKILDLLLTYLIEEPIMVAPLFNGILNCLSFVMKQRPMATMRILSCLLKFNIDLKYQQDYESALQYRLSKRFVERCYKNFVQFGLKQQLIKNSGSMSQYHSKLSKISQTLHIIGEETKSKGILNFDASQLQRKMSSKDKEKYLKSRSVTPNAILSPQLNESSSVLPLSSDLSGLIDLQKYTMSKNSTTFFNSSPVAFDNKYSSIYSLMNSKSSEIDLSQFSHELLVKLCTDAFYQTDNNKMISGLSIIASRYTDLMNKSVTKRKRQDDSKDEFANEKRLQAFPIKSEELHLDDDDILENSDRQDLTFIKPMSPEEKHQHLLRIIKNLTNVDKLTEIQTTDDDKNTSVINILSRPRLLSWNNKTSWVTLLIRLGTRGINHDVDMSKTVRQAIYDYFVQDFTNRISVVIEWLSEEWYYESLYDSKTPIYDEWSLKVLDGLVPFLENNHRRLFIRLVSELPRLTQEHIDRIQSLCFDPIRNSLGFQSLRFMLMFRPPMKPIIKNILEDMRKTDESVKDQCESILAKFY